jgi:hypothetical protein
MNRPPNPFLKLLKIVRYEPEPFSVVLMTLGLKRKNKTLSKWPKILTPAVKESRLERGIKTRLNRGT